MDFKQCQYILKIAELKNMTKAANELYVSQPSLSHYVAKVEEEVGAPLFNRNTNPISLTPAGEKYVETARMILDLNGRLKQEITDITNNRRGVITIGISHARAAYFLPYVMPEFHEKYPGVDIRTIETRSDHIIEEVEKGQCDFGVLPFPIAQNSELEQEVICREELFLVAGHELKEGKICEDGKKAYVELSGCGGYAFNLLKKGHGIRTAVDVLFMEHGISPERIFETTSNETAYRLATVDAGLSIVPACTVKLSNPVQIPWIYSIGEKGVFWEMGVIYRKKEFLSQSQRDIIVMLREQFGNN